MLADANLEHFPSKECFIQVSSDQLVVAGSEEDDEGEDAARRPEDEDGDDRNARQRKLNYSTKVFEGVPIIVKGDFLICQQRKLTLHCVDGRRVLIVLRQYLRFFYKTNNVLTDGEYSGERGKSDWPVTLPPRLLKDGFAIQPTKVGEHDW